MKKLASLTALSLLALLIVLPTVCSVNHFVGEAPVIGRTLVADGWPMPPPIPPSAIPLASYADTLLADGWPMPPPIPPSKKQLADPYSV